MPRQPSVLVFTGENRAHRTWDRCGNWAPLTAGLVPETVDKNTPDQKKRDMPEKWIYLATVKLKGEKKEGNLGVGTEG